MNIKYTKRYITKDLRIYSEARTMSLVDGASGTGYVLSARNFPTNHFPCYRQRVTLDKVSLPNINRKNLDDCPMLSMHPADLVLPARFSAEHLGDSIGVKTLKYGTHFSPSVSPDTETQKKIS